MTLYRILLLLALLPTILLASCGDAAPHPDRAPTVHYGEDICDQCGMIISDERFAAALVVELSPAHYENRLFDDIGGLLNYLEATDESVASIFVHDYNSTEWIDGEDAFYVRAKDLHTPMGFGLAACADEAEAADLAAAVGGSIVRFADLVNAGTKPAANSHHYYD